MMPVIAVCLAVLVVLEGLQLWLRYRHELHAWRVDRWLARRERQRAAAELAELRAERAAMADVRKDR